MQTYRPRIVDRLLDTYLAASPAVQLAGAHASGKITTGLQAASSVAQIDRMGTGIDREADVAELLVEGYLDNLAENEFPFVGGPRRSPQRFLHFVRAYARTR